MIRYVVLHHQDPDLCACLPLLEQVINYGKMRIVTHSMASTRHLSAVMETMAKLDLEMILPQHGSIIPKGMIPLCIDFLKKLPCGIDAQVTEEALYSWISVGKHVDKKYILWLFQHFLYSHYPHKQALEMCRFEKNHQSPG